MTKITLSMLLSAVMTSAWWAAARWPDLGSGALWALAVSMSIPVIITVIVQTADNWNK